MVHLESFFYCYESLLGQSSTILVYVQWSFVEYMFRYSIIFILLLDGIRDNLAKISPVIIDCFEYLTFVYFQFVPYSW